MSRVDQCSHIQTRAELVFQPEGVCVEQSSRAYSCVPKARLTIPRTLCAASAAVRRQDFWPSHLGRSKVNVASSNKDDKEFASRFGHGRHRHAAGTALRPAPGTFRRRAKHLVKRSKAIVLGRRPLLVEDMLPPVSRRWRLGTPESASDIVSCEKALPTPKERLRTPGELPVIFVGDVEVIS
jgi:hypothetical protein